MKKPASALVAVFLNAGLARFRQDERGVMGVFMIMIFFLMLVFGGIAVDVMRFETRRVTLQQTMDRAALAAASLSQTGDGKAIAEEWFDISGLNDEDMAMVDFSAPVVGSVNDAGLRRVWMTANVTSANFFMHWLGVNYLRGPAMSEAAQGVDQIEVMLVLDISGSMGSPAADGDTKTKIEALRDSASYFVDVVKENDVNNQISIGYVPYNAQVNIPANLRSQYTVTNLSTWGGVANAGVPNINCIEIPTSSYTSTALSRTTSMRMAAVADTRVADTAENPTPTGSGYVAAGAYPPSTNPLHRICNTIPDDAGTAHDESTANHLMLPTKNSVPLLAGISHLTAGGFTSIAVGMRWGTALIDQTARPIYTAIGDASVAGRPVDNDDAATRKIIILMTDGEHVSTDHIKDAYKTGLSPIYLGTDGNYAIRFWSSGPALNSLNRTTSCAGTNLQTAVSGQFREYFVPHLKTGTGTTCVLNAWKFTPQWTNAAGTTITTRRLDWSEVWQRLRLTYVARQLYARANVTGAEYSNAMSMMRQGYINATNLDTYLQQNCTAAKQAGVEIYGIAFAAPDAGEQQIRSCATDENDYFFDAQNEASLQSAFRAIAVDISKLRLTQ